MSEQLIEKIGHPLSVLIRRHTFLHRKQRARSIRLVWVRLIPLFHISQHVSLNSLCRLVIKRLHGIANLSRSCVNKQVACVTNVRTSQMFVMVGRESSAEQETATRANQTNRDQQKRHFSFHYFSLIDTLIVLCVNISSQLSANLSSFNCRLLISSVELCFKTASVTLVGIKEGPASFARFRMPCNVSMRPLAVTHGFWRPKRLKKYSPEFPLSKLIPQANPIKV